MWTQRKHKESTIRDAFAEWIIDMSQILWQEVFFVGKEVRIESHGRTGYIDLLYKDKENSLFVIELKVVDLEVEHIFQVEWYMQTLLESKKEWKLWDVNNIYGILLWASFTQWIKDFANERSIEVFSF